MTFEEYWSEVEKLKVLPNTAIKQLPSVLSGKTKSELMRRTAEDAVEILKKAIETIDLKGSANAENAPCVITFKLLVAMLPKGFNKDEIRAFCRGEDTRLVSSTIFLKVS